MTIEELEAWQEEFEQFPTVKYPENWFIRSFRAKGLQPYFVNRSEKKN